ncbi:dihydroxyacetone kinase subunit DhaK [Melghirimyces algeriensis]|uniref:Dihydroxyacetone kinase DhaK subunit n=1 Tax=Melghirimyces algeriensis TaxID=910412 RepID=A0A521CD16_9BACL|nr:dihydroxyacetone kinase subunit DhaK [Melghirimyces algeriensis]SMO56691.1 dihydroxyacetone kinase DhaK subunit [Melghirimyces algeriensis]
MKKVMNQPENIVDEMLEGMVQATPNRLRYLKGKGVLVRTDAPVDGKVGLVSGGGSGHEPAHGGFVGRGMLDAAVAGEVFTSPTPDRILEAIKAVDSGKGVLCIVKNYTGDVLNFDMAAELAAAEGIQVEQVVVNDDVAVEDSTHTTGRRGIAGTVFVHKIAGAKADQGASLEEVKRVAEKGIRRIRSMGVALTPCTLPEAGKPSFTLEEDEIEIGIGIHGEPGVERTKLLSASALTRTLADRIYDDLPYRAGDRVAVMVNGMGSTPLMELNVIHKEFITYLNEKQNQVVDSWVGEYMTSLDMAGFSLTLFQLDEELESLLAHPVDTMAVRFGK